MTNLEFISAIAPIIQREAMKNGYAFPSAVIAQACLESGYGASSLAATYHNYFGIKWYRGCGRNAVNLATKEEYTPGVLTSITSGFCVGTSMDDGVRMYFEFLEKNSRYKNLKSATSSRNFLELIKADGYATSTNYVANTYKVVEKYNLTQYDTQSVTAVSYAGQVTASALYVRSGPSATCPALKLANHDLLLPKGIIVAIEAEAGNFGKLAGVDGWVSLDYIKK